MMAGTSIKRKSGELMSTSNNEIVTVRPTGTTMTRQQLPNFVGISGATAGAEHLSNHFFILSDLTQYREIYLAAAGDTAKRAALQTRLRKVRYLISLRALRLFAVRNSAHVFQPVPHRF
jgi:hypothetical protein